MGSGKHTIIGYVSMPFGVKRRIDFTGIYRTAIFPAPRMVAKGEPCEVFLFREDEDIPPLQSRHERRLDDFGRADRPPETRLREEIQRHIILADFVIADMSGNNPNVLLEIGFAQALSKRIIYLTQSFRQMPSNLGDLKRIIIYESDRLEQLKISLFFEIADITGDIKLDETKLRERGGRIEYFPCRRDVELADKFRAAQHTIQILTTNLTTVSADYIDAIVEAIGIAKSEKRHLAVTVLTSDPTNPFVGSRARQLNEDARGYEYELQGSLASIAAKLRRFPGCKILTYRDFPVQLWHRIDEMIYVGYSSLLRRTRHNSVFAVPIDVPGVKDTFLDHFDALVKRSSAFKPRTERQQSGLIKGKHGKSTRKTAKTASGRKSIKTRR